MEHVEVQATTVFLENNQVFNMLCKYVCKREVPESEKVTGRLMPTLITKSLINTNQLYWTCPRSLPRALGQVHW